MNRRRMKLTLGLLTLIAISTVPFYFYKPLSKQEKVATLFPTNIPTTSQQVREYVENTIALFHEESDKFLSLSSDERTFDNTIGHWDSIGKMLIERMVVLKSMDVIEVSMSTRQAAEEAFEKIQIALKNKLAITPNLAIAMLQYLEKASADPSLSEAQCLYLYQLANSINTQWFPLAYQKKIDEIKEAIEKLPKANFTYYRGNADVKYLEGKKTSLSLLNLNVCFLPGQLPLLYGGMKPWKQRIEKVAERIKRLDADVICLQEVFEDAAGQRLFQLLKDTYAFFYINIGPRNFGFDQETAGLGSGLFVASKLEIDAPQFKRFTATAKHMNRGVFDFFINHRGHRFAHIYTTHLEPFATTPGPEFRKQQIDLIVQEMNQSLAKEGEDCAIILCGDLNIPWGSQEPAEDILKASFCDACNKKEISVNMKNRTYVDFTDLWWKADFNLSKFTPKPEILDYALLFKNLHTRNIHFQMYTAIIPMNNLEHPLDALSDHHGQISLLRYDTQRR